MKTTKIFSIFSLALILTAAITSFSAPIDKKNDQVSVRTMIRYQVNITLSADKPICNMWLVKIVDQNGRQIAPAKPFISGVSGYEFFERGPVNGTRLAVLVRDLQGDHYVCETELHTAPSAITGKFLDGQTYRFELVPSFQSPKE
ncbi:MAG: hypothetical protein ACOYNC_02530 [Bacteroidales bacterium]